MSGPACPVLPCLSEAAFFAFCRDNADNIYGLTYIWHQPLDYHPGFYTWSHAVALDADGEPAACCKIGWPARGSNMAHIDTFLSKIASWMKPEPEIRR